mmetsp:Transcript_96112/g.214049  ORF Transcript_96112/g.214049 Transcript_96112/m.214049 type:complete len:799 (-) Transcript_96112:82-2478(-)
MMASGEDERVVAAREALKRAVHQRSKVGELQAAIEEGEAVGLYAVELENARWALDEERKLAARAKFKECQESGDAAQWKAAIRVGKAVGLSGQELEAAAQSLAEEERREAARLALTRAEDGNTLDMLQAAVKEAAAAGLKAQEMERAQSALAEEALKMTVAEGLREALRSGDLRALEASVREGERVKLGRRELEEPRRVLCEEALRQSARAALKDAMLKKTMGLENQISDLQAALREAEAVGLSAEELVPGQVALDRDRREVSARQCLREAISGRQPEEIRLAIEAAEVAGVEPLELAAAREVMEDSRKPAAVKQLKEAVASRQIEELMAAIAHGEAVGMTSLGLQEARETLKAEERKIDARRKLQSVEGSGSLEINVWKVAIASGTAAGLEDVELEGPRRTLASLQRKAAARAAMAEALQSRLTEELRAAVREGEAADLDVSELEPGRRALAEEWRASAKSALTDATRGRKIPILQSAISNAASAGLGEEDPEFKGALKALQEEERKVMARGGLQLAEKSLQVSELQAAIQEGESAGLSYPELRATRAILVVEVEKESARANLRKAQLSRDMEDLEKAIQKGGFVKLEPWELEAAQKAFAEEKRKAAARAALVEAKRRCEPKQLQAAIDEGTLAGIEAELLDDAGGVLLDKLHSDAREAVKKAMSSCQVPALRLAVRLGAKAGLNEEELLPARRLYTEVRLGEALSEREVHKLQGAIEQAEVWPPGEAELVEQARQLLQREEAKATARMELKDAERLCEVAGLTAAIRTGHDSGLEEWEMRHAYKALEIVRLGHAGI